MKSIAILGGGLSGLTQAWKAQKCGKKVTIFEENSRLGGVIQSERTKEGFLLDYGPNSLSLRKQNLFEMLEQLDILDHAIDANVIAKKRFIVRAGKLVALPLNFPTFLSSRFLSPTGKLRILLEPFIRKSKSSSESVAQFIERRLGREVLDYAANPFLGGVFAARPETLSLPNAFPALAEMERQNGSIFRGFLASRKKFNRMEKTRLISFPNGMEELITRFEMKVQCSILRKHSAKEIESVHQNGWKIKCTSENGSQSILHFDELICTLPATQISSIKWTNVKNSKDLNVLSTAPHFPLSLVFLGFEREQIEHPLDGFGFLVPELENRKILGTLFSSTLFSNRAPEGKVLLTTFVGGERQPHLAEMNDGSLFQSVSDELSCLLGVKGKPIFQKIKRWPLSIPLPDSRMSERKDAARRLSSLNNGLSFSGSHLTGVSLPNCLEG